MPFKNDMPDITFQSLLKQRGIDESKVTYLHRRTCRSRQSVLTKDFDVAFLPEPLASACILRGKKMGVEVVRSFDFYMLGQKLSAANR